MSERFAARLGIDGRIVAEAHRTSIEKISAQAGVFA
jgi:hypothetical protein